jgi:hypothetical protein
MAYKKNKYWTNSERELLKRMAKEGKSLPEIADALEGRTIWGVFFEARSMSVLDTGIKPQALSDRKSNQKLTAREVHYNHDLPWTERDEQMLVSMLTEFYSMEQIEQKLDRFNGAIVSHLKKMSEQGKIKITELFNLIRPYMSLRKV